MLLGRRLRRKRVLIPLVSVLAALVLGVALNRTDLLILGRGSGGSSMAPTLPACDGRWLGEGFTYRWRDPHHGEVVFLRVRGTLGGPLVPDPDSRDLALGKRVIGVPGDTVVARNGRVYVNGKKADDIETGAFPPVQLDSDQYFVLGDNRSFSQDSRDFGPVPREAIFGRVRLIYWPLGRFGVPTYEKTLVPPGEACRP